MDLREIPIGALDMVRGARPGPSPDLADGTLAVCENLRPTAPDGDRGATYAPVQGPGTAVSGVASAQSAWFQVRQRPVDDDSTGAAGALRRWLVLTPSQIRAVDETGAAVVLHAFGASDTDRRATFAPAGSKALCAVRVPDANGGWEPEALLLLSDDDALAVGGMPTGDVYLEPAPSEVGEVFLAMRCALALGDGTFGPPGPLRLFDFAYDTAPAGDSLGKVVADLSLGDTITGGAPLSVSAAWQAQSRGVALFVGTGLTAEESLQAPPRLATTIEWADILAAAGGAVTVDLDELAGAEPLRDDLLTQHQLAAVGVASYNRRAVYSGVSYTFAPPALGRVGSGTSYRLAVRIQTTSGDRWVLGPVTACDAGTLTSFNSQAWSYPDRRAVEMVVYRPNGGYREVKRTDLVAPPGLNLAYSLAGTVPDSAGTEPLLVEPPAAVDFDPNRVLYSEPLAPLQVPAANALYVGDGPEDAVRAVLPLTEPVSVGQFGQFPLVAVCARSAWAIETGTEPFVTAVTPLALGLGAPTPEACAVVGGRPVVASTTGVRFVDAGIAGPSASLPVETAAVLAALAAGTAAFGVHRGPEGDELWLAADGDTYCLHLPTGRWYVRPGLDRSAFASRDGQIHGLDGGTIVPDDDDVGDVAVVLETAPIDLGTRAQGADLRLRRAALAASGPGAAGPDDSEPAPVLRVLSASGTALASAEGTPRDTGAPGAPLPDAGTPVVVLGTAARRAVRLRYEATLAAEQGPGAHRIAALVVEAEARRPGRRFRRH